MRKCLSKLSVIHREVLDLVYYHEKSVKRSPRSLECPSMARCHVLRTSAWRTMLGTAVWIGSEGASRRLFERQQNATFPNSQLVPPRCEACGGIMKLHRREPRLGPHPELTSFRCQQCGHVVTLVAEDER